jgi:RHS repeat-associated protein
MLRACKFTGKERDTESGLDNFGARCNASTMGRWMSPDMPFADQNPENPQSWNLYGYVSQQPAEQHRHKWPSYMAGGWPILDALCQGWDSTVASHLGFSLHWR